jgi:Tfp pilus assembly protein PilN
MIRTNLATRRFYDERAVHTWVLIGALLVGAATVFNVGRVLKYSRSDTQLAGEASRDETRAAQLRQQAMRLRSTVDPKQIDFASNEARQANELIDRRTFSWTELFNRFETTLPDEVRITAVRPQMDKQRGIVLSIAAIARSNEDMELFMERLRETGVFPSVQPIEEHFDEAGLLETAIEALYAPGARGAQARGQD